MGRAMIFHYPAPLPSSLSSGSHVRVLSMLEAFRQIGYEVEVVAGEGSQRARAVRRLKDDFGSGRRFEFVYSESLSIPTLLTEEHHVPTHPFLDFGFLGWLRQRGTPVGLFYRDVYWRFEEYRRLFPWHKRTIIVPFHRYDLFKYRRVLDHLFLPSRRMAEALPVAWPENEYSALPPGCRIVDNTGHRYAPVEGNLRMLYVGGVSPPAYDIKPLLEAATVVTGVSLKICCRPAEWAEMRGRYPINADSQVEIVHASGQDLAAHYAEADVFCMVRTPNRYLDFAMPVKLLESLGFGVPVITMGGGETARFITTEDTGWVVQDQRDLLSLLPQLRDTPDMIAAKRHQLRAVQQRHSWTARADSVAATLTRTRN